MRSQTVTQTWPQETVAREPVEAADAVATALTDLARIARLSPEEQQVLPTTATLRATDPHARARTLCHLIVRTLRPLFADQTVDHVALIPIHDLFLEMLQQALPAGSSIDEYLARGAKQLALQRRLNSLALHFQQINTQLTAIGNAQSEELQAQFEALKREVLQATTQQEQITNAQNEALIALQTRVNALSVRLADAGEEAIAQDPAIMAHSNELARSLQSLTDTLKRI